jgi:Zn-dependent protease
VKCKQCGTEEYMPFKCPYCGDYFCATHRLPENHDCPEYWRVRASREKTAEMPRALKTEPSYKYTVTVTPPGKGGRAIWFSPTELKHLAMGIVLTLAIGFSMPLYWNPELYGQPDVLTVLAATFTFSFIIHELAHKITAQRYGLWAEFRITMTGALITLVSIVSPIKIISPGAVMIGGHADKETIGKTSVAGPLTNIMLALLFLALTMTLFDSPIAFAFYFGLLVNSIIAVFNLIPFGILDGFKVFSWNKTVWATAFSVSLALTIYSNFFLL